MVDVKFWGPSGWKFLHTLTFQQGYDEEKREVFSVLEDILPCKYCRMSTKKFISEMPITDNLPFWLYKFHDRVNKKLEAQNSEDPKIPMPIPSPSFAEVSRMYKNASGNPLNGRDFLYAMAFNFDKKLHSLKSHRIFWNSISTIYSLDIPSMTTNKKYLNDVRLILGDKRSFEEVYEYVSKYKSACSKKTFRGKTCRKKKRL